MQLFAFMPAPLGYQSPAVWLLCGSGIGLLLLSAAMRRMTFPQSVRMATRTWPTMLLVYGFGGLLLGVSEAEGITFLSMRFLPLLWLFLLLLTVTLHALFWKKRAYTVVRQQRVHDPRDTYLPGKRH